MAKKIKVLFTIYQSSTLILLYFLFCTLHLFSAFMDTSFGVRPEGMGGAFVALSDDINAMYYNPAGSAILRLRETNFIYGVPFLGLPNVSLYYMNASFVYPIKKIASLGFSYNSYHQTELYNESMIIFSIGKIVNDFWQVKPKLLVGANLKYLNHTFNPDEYLKGDPVFGAGTSKENISIDLGALFIPFKKLSIGAVFKNINNPDLGLKSEDRVPTEMSFGLAYKSGSKGIFENMTLPIEFSLRQSDPPEFMYKIGFETWFMLQTFGIRFGYNNYGVTLGFSFYKFISEKLQLRIDYATGILNQIDDDYFTHRISFGLRF